jgi:6-phosphogluconolactonase
MIRSWLRILSALAMSFVLLECKQAAPLRPQFAYIANFYSSLLSAYSIGYNGDLTPVPRFALRRGRGGRPISVTVDLTAKFAYVANFASNNISAFSIGSNGVLTPVPGSPFAGGQAPCSVAVEPMTKFAYVANRGSDDVWAYSIASNGP